MTVLPFQFGLPSKFGDSVLGTIRKLTSDEPEFVIDTEEVSNMDVYSLFDVCVYIYS